MIDVGRYRRSPVDQTRADGSELQESPVALPLALARLHRALGVGEPFDLRVRHGDDDRASYAGGVGVPGAWRPDDLAAVLAGAGFDVDRMAVDGDDVRAQGSRAPEPFGGRPAYLMPSTSGLNAHSSRADLAVHLAAASRLASAAVGVAP